MFTIIFLKDLYTFMLLNETKKSTQQNACQHYIAMYETLFPI